MREKVMAVPKLRFAEFNGSWSVGPLEDVLDLKSGYIFKSETYVEGGRYRVITIANVQDGRMSFDRVSTVATLPNNIRPFQVLQQGDILISLTGNVGRVCLVEVDDCLLNQRVGKLVPKAHVDKDFLYQVLRNQVFLNAMVEQAQGGAQDNLSSKDVLGYEATLPTLPEQQKISAFLGAVDRKIQQLKRKQALLEQYKKGVVQQLFSQELRFKRGDGSEYPEWEEKRLGDICEVNPSTGALPDSFIYIDLESVENGVLLKESRISADEAPSRAQRVLRAKDVLFQLVRPYQMNNLYFDKSGDYVASTGYAQLRAKGDPRFLFQYLHYQPFVSEVLERSTGSNYPAIRPTDLAEIIVPVPSLEEQSRIAGFLMALDAKVAGVAQAAAAAERWKRGLLQQMFV